MMTGRLIIRENDIWIDTRQFPREWVHLGIDRESGRIFVNGTAEQPNESRESPTEWD
jgi:hypothetical protein